MRILLTGSSGFIGGAFARAWREKYTLFAPTHAELDLLDAAATEAYLREHRVDTVIHAANANNVTHPELEGRQLDCNLRMFCNLERCSRFYGKMLCFGSGAEYDMRHYLPKMREDRFGAHIPADPYGFSKYLISRLAERTDNVFVFRLFGVYGPGEEWRRRFLSNMIYQGMHAPQMRMDRNMLFDYLYIDDLISAVDGLLTRTPKQRHYNLCSGQTHSLYELAVQIRDELAVDKQIMMNGTDWKPEYSGDNSRFVGEFGALHITPMRESIQRMIAYYRENGFR